VFLRLATDVYFEERVGSANFIEKTVGLEDYRRIAGAIGTFMAEMRRRSGQIAGKRPTNA